jgi:outer membrane protein OmpA-like peptidoglycan-associated protein
MPTTPRTAPAPLLIAALASASLFLSACESLKSVATDPDTQNTRRGAAIGAGVGAVAGLLTGGDKLQRALIGAAVGGLAGGAIGNYQDRQEKKLREEMANSGVDVVRQGDNITLDIPGGVTFAVDSAEINSNFRPILDRVASTLVEYDQTLIEVAGHTDSSGSESYNQSLSERRASSVAAYLSSRGVPMRRVVTLGAGELHPIATNDTAAGREQNRRVEVTIVPVAQQTAQAR